MVAYFARYLSGKIEISLLESDSVPTDPSSPAQSGLVEETHRLACRLNAHHYDEQLFGGEIGEKEKQSGLCDSNRGGSEEAKAVRIMLT